VIRRPFREEAWRPTINVPRSEQDFIKYNVIDRVFLWNEFLINYLFFQIIDGFGRHEEEADARDAIFNS